MKSKNILLALACVLGSLNLSAAPAPLFDDPVIAKGKGVEVRRVQLEDAFTAYKANLAARGQSLPEDRRTATEAQLLDRIIITQLLAGRATPADNAKAVETANKFINASRTNAISEDFFFKQIKALGMSPAQFTNRVVEQAAAEEVINREIKDKITVTPDQIKKFYDDNPVRQPEMARVSHVLFTTKNLETRDDLSAEQKKDKRAKAEALLARAKKGEDFTKLAVENSEDPGVKENKGEYKFARAKDDPQRAMVPEFEAASFSLKTNQVSEIVTSDFGYHIIKLHELIPAKQVELAELSPRIKDILTQQEMEKVLPDFFEKLKKDADVKILDAKLVPAPKPPEPVPAPTPVPPK